MVLRTQFWARLWIVSCFLKANANLLDTNEASPNGPTFPNAGIPGQFPGSQTGFPQFLGPSQYPGSLPLMQGGLPQIPMSPSPYAGGPNPLFMSPTHPLSQGLVVMCPLDLIFPSAPIHPMCQSPHLNAPLQNFPPHPQPMSPNSMPFGNSLDQSHSPQLRMFPGQTPPMLPPYPSPLIDLNPYVEPISLASPINMQPSFLAGCPPEALKLLGVRPTGLNLPLAVGGLPMPILPQRPLQFPTGNSLQFPQQNPLSPNMMPFQPQPSFNAMPMPMPQVNFNTMPMPNVNFNTMPMPNVNFNALQYPLSLNALQYPMAFNTLANAFPILIAANRMPYNSYTPNSDPYMQQYNPYTMNRMNPYTLNGFNSQLYFNNPVPVVPVMNGTKSLL